MIYSFSNFGFEGAMVNVEVDVRKGIPAVDIVGLADACVKESIERVRSAISNSGFEMPPERVLISLSPADLRKDGSAFDLAIALEIINRGQTQDTWLVLGELELSGNVRPVRGVHAAVSTALACGITKVICHKVSVNEALAVNGVEVYGVESLNEAQEVIKGNAEKSAKGETEMREEIETVMGINFQKEEKPVNGYGKAKRALAVAIASGESILFHGVPGCGKTMLMQWAKCLLPEMTKEEAMVTTRVWSLAGLLRPNEDYLHFPSFRKPHQTASIEGICGGGIQCRPGEISLSHNGVLFLDEAAEFRTSVLQMLRVPLETGHITLSRAGRSTMYPADFQLFIATNPCPCGNYGANDRICLCSARSIEMYWRKFGSPLLDRVAIRMEITKDESEVDTRTLREMIARAKTKARERGYTWSHAVGVVLNKIPEQFMEKLGDISQRQITQITHLALTLADMHGTEKPTDDDWKEAIELRGELPLGM